jgi:hypothetical protein
MKKKIVIPIDGLQKIIPILHQYCNLQEESIVLLQNIAEYDEFIYKNQRHILRRSQIVTHLVVFDRTVIMTSN